MQRFAPSPDCPAQSPVKVTAATRARVAEMLSAGLSYREIRFRTGLVERVIRDIEEGRA